MKLPVLRFDENAKFLLFSPPYDHHEGRTIVDHHGVPPESIRGSCLNPKELMVGQGAVVSYFFKGDDIFLGVRHSGHRVFLCLLLQERSGSLVVVAQATMPVDDWTHWRECLED